MPRPKALHQNIAQITLPFEACYPTLVHPGAPEFQNHCIQEKHAGTLGQKLIHSIKCIECSFIIQGVVKSLRFNEKRIGSLDRRELSV